MHSRKYYRRYLAHAFRELHNDSMGLGVLFLEFLQRIAVGAGTVLALFLIVWLGMRRRSPIAADRRTAR